MYVFEEERLIKEIKEKQPKRVLLQLPEGLKKEGLTMASFIQEHCHTEVILSGEPVWGACDIAVNEAKSLSCDLIVLYGHAPFMDIDFPVLYIEARYEKNIMHLLPAILEKVQDKKSIAITSSVQHIHQIPVVKKFFESKGVAVHVPKGKGHAFYDGQVLGCEYTGLKLLAKDVDAVFMIANKFHALGAALSVDKEVILFDPCSEQISSMNTLKEKIIKQRAVAIGKAKEANKIGIIVGKKVGQSFGSLDYIKEKMKKLEKEYVIIAMNEVTNDKLVNLHDIEAFVELACPRIAIEDVARFEKPLLTAREFAVLCKDMEWEELLTKGFL